MPQSALISSLKHRLGQHVCVACETIDGADGLLGDEEKHIANAVPKRLVEFAAGRRAARRVLMDLGAPKVPILAAESRAPIWPKGIVGSISHDQDMALAIAAKSENIAILGIDVTEAAPLPGATRRHILHSDEEHKLDDLEARAAFAIKECLYKALFPAVQKFFGFDAAIAKPDFGTDSFSVTLSTDLGPYTSGTTYDGILVANQQVIITALTLAAD